MRIHTNYIFNQMPPVAIETSFLKVALAIACKNFFKDPGVTHLEGRAGKWLTLQRQLNHEGDRAASFTRRLDALTANVPSASPPFHWNIQF